MNFAELQNFLIAIAIGGLIGLEREIGARAREKYAFAGFRTFILISFLGALSYFIGDKFALPYLSVATFVTFSLFVIVTYYITANKGFLGITSELSSIITFLLGILVMQTKYQIVAVVFAVLIAILLAFKKYVHALLERTKIEEWYDTLKFAFIAFVILPLLPNQDYGVYGFFNPYKTWLMVVFVSGVSFVGYFAIKFLGSRVGVSLSGLLGGIASSTAVTTSMAEKSKSVSSKEYKPFVIATILASGVMLVRLLVISSAISLEFARSLIIPSCAMFFAGLIPTAILWIKGLKDKKTDLKLKSPFSLKPALTFAVIYLAVQIAVKSAVNRQFGNIGLIITSMIGGVTEVDAITLSMSTFAKNGVVTYEVAKLAILSAVLANTILKGSIAWFWGGKKYRVYVNLILLVMTLVGVITVFIF